MAAQSVPDEPSGLSIDRSGLFQVEPHSHEMSPRREPETPLLKHLKALIQVLHHALTQAVVTQPFPKEDIQAVTYLCQALTVLDITEQLPVRSSGAALSLWRSTCR